MGDSYRYPSGPPPGPPPRPRTYARQPSPRREYDRREPAPRRGNDDVFQFKGAAARARDSHRDNFRDDNPRDDRNHESHVGRGASYRPAYHSRPRSRSRSPRRHDGHQPRHPDGYPSRDYRPEDDRSSTFDFRYDAPATINQGMREYEQQAPPSRDSRRGANSRNNPGGRGRQYGSRGARGGRGGFVYVPKKAADRPFLQGGRQPTPELMHGMEEEEGAASKFRDLEDMSDSDEEDMDTDDSEAEEHKPRKKMARTSNKAADGDSVPKWSNPDPYTALPPPDDSLAKKKDVVKLIRKARVVGTDAPKPAAETDDFISFDFGADEDNDELNSYEHASSTSGAPPGPRSQALQSQQEHGTGTGQAQMPTEQVDSHSSDHSQGQPRPSDVTPAYSHKETLYESLPARPPPPPLPVDQALGNRKRTFDDEIKGPPPFVPVVKKAPMKAANGKVVKDWAPKSGVDPIPWCIDDHSQTENMGAWLHKEIVDFYNHVRPQEFESVIRGDVLQQLSSMTKQWRANADCKPFGSYPAGLYLPTADMDLVIVSKQYMDGGYGNLATRHTLFNFRNFVVDNKLCVPGSVEVISGAKVPLVKYVDRITGLKIDISFENDTGLVANHTFQTWKKRYPAMPILVTLLKQFLTMRGLNEPVNGGIGGFSVICLVVSFLSLVPQVQSGNMTPEHNLGEVLMEFFHLYGNEFNTKTTAIRLNPPGYIPKSRVNQPYKFKGRSNGEERRFSILDPNNQENDISGGSKNTATIVDAFAKAHKTLKTRLAEVQRMSTAERRDQSVLGCILAGDYSSFDAQRAHLKYLHSTRR